MPALTGPAAAADVLNNWALVHFRGDIAKAEPLYRRALELRRSIEGTDSVSPTFAFNVAGVLSSSDGTARPSPSTNR